MGNAQNIPVFQSVMNITNMCMLLYLVLSTVNQKQVVSRLNIIFCITHGVVSIMSILVPCMHSLVLSCGLSFAGLVRLGTDVLEQVEFKSRT